MGSGDFDIEGARDAVDGCAKGLPLAFMLGGGEAIYPTVLEITEEAKKRSQGKEYPETSPMAHLLSLDRELERYGAEFTRLYRGYGEGRSRSHRLTLRLIYESAPGVSFVVAKDNAVRVRDARDAPAVVIPKAVANHIRIVLARCAADPHIAILVAEADIVAFAIAMYGGTIGTSKAQIPPGQPRVPCSALVNHRWIIVTDVPGRNTIKPLNRGAM